VPVSDRDIALRAFSTPEWRSAADALFQATGISVNVMDFAACDSLAGTHSCAFCHAAAEISAPAPLSCFDSPPPPQAGPGRVVCRAGLAALYAPVLRDDTPIAHVVLSGFVTSTRERRGLYQQLINRGLSEDAARRALKSLPIVARRQADSYLQMAIASARTIVDATVDRMAAAERIEELRLFVSAGHQVVSADKLDSDALSAIAEEAVAIIGGEAGAILRPRGSFLEVVARTEGWRGPVGALVPKVSTASGRAVETARTVVSPGRNGGSATLAMPLLLGGRVLGVLEARVPRAAVPLPADRVSRLGRFGQFVAIALEREDERSAVERAMSGYAQLNELAAALGGQSDINGISQLLVSVIDKSFAFQLAGLVLTGWGNDRADVVVDGNRAQSEIDYVLGVVAGRDVLSMPFGSMRHVTHRGDVTECDPAAEWSINAVELSHGDLTVGYLFVARCDGAHYGAQDRALLEGIAAHGGAAFGRAALFSRIRDDYAKTIAALSATLDLGERVPNGHAGRVMEYSMAMGEELGLKFEDIEQLRFAGLLHDIGKTGLPEEILLKPSKLTAEEFAQVQKHAEIGASIVDQIDFLKGLTPVILHHHERWDGKGYPHKLKGEEIPLLARVLGVADSFDAMTGDRAYRPKMSMSQARLEMESAAGTQYDPRVVAALFEVLDRMALAGGTGLLAPKEAQGRPDLLA